MQERSLIFVGDIAYPFPGSVSLDGYLEVFGGAYCIGNLEGPIGTHEMEVTDRHKYNLFSCDGMMSLADSFNLRAVSVANNHFGDFRGGGARSLKQLSASNIGYFGLRSKPILEIRVGGCEYAILGACAQVTDGRYGPESPIQVLHPARLTRVVGRYRRENPDKKLILYVHWGYELSPYPQPADREWARAVIRSGATAVIGHHPHVVQGIEEYAGGLIAYSVGNWIMPQVRFREKVLQYPEEQVSAQLAIEINLSAKKWYRLHWFEYSKASSSIAYMESGERVGSGRDHALTPFAGLSDKQYRSFFREQGQAGRGSPRGYPTFVSYHASRAPINFCKHELIRVRKRVRRYAMVLGWHRPYDGARP